MSDAKYWLGFNAIPSLNPQQLDQLHHAFGEMRTAWEASEPSLRLAGLPTASVERIVQARPGMNLDAEWAKVEGVGAQLLTQTDERYPKALVALADAPAVLYMCGTLYPSDRLALAMVGTRHPSPHGLATAYRWASELGKNGITIVSGLAKGCDAAAHQGAMDGGGRTISVLGSGIDVIYPRDHVQLAAHIAQQGALLTEFAPGTPPRGSNFPRRNRLISGLAMAVLIMEAPADSGALLTAKTAFKQGRPVMVWYDERNPSCDTLVAQGALPVRSAWEVLARIDERSSEALPPAPSMPQTAPKPVSIDELLADDNAPDVDDKRRVLAALSQVPTHLDDLAEQLGTTSPLLMGLMTSLELAGLIEVVGSSRYRLARR
jgi:DNA processing protein